MTGRAPPPWGDGPITPLTEVFGGRYVLLDEIAQGDLSVVYRARLVGEPEPIAFKLIQPRYAEDEAQVRRFRRGAELLRKIEHPNLVRMVEAGRIEDGRDFIALELLAGRTLADALVDTPRMSPERTCRILRQVARALRAMHRARVIHRDLKPENVLLTGPEDGERVKVVDFSDAGDVGAPARRVRVASRIESGGVGKEFDYRAPEQRQNRPPTPSMDIFALGVLMYEMLAGEHPFVAPSPGSSRRMGPNTIRTKVFDAPEELLGLVVDCIESEPSDRPRSIDEVIERIDKALLWLGVVPHAVTAEAPDEDARTQIWSAADPASVDPPRRKKDDSPEREAESVEEQVEPTEEVGDEEVEREEERVERDENDRSSSDSDSEAEPEVREAAQDDGLVVVDTVAWTKPEPSAEPRRSKKRRESAPKRSRPRTSRAAPLPAQVLPRWVAPLAALVIAVLAYAVWMVWTH